MVEFQPSKLAMRVRFPLPAPKDIIVAPTTLVRNQLKYVEFFVD